jgi:hypothetical protein
MDKILQKLKKVVLVKLALTEVKILFAVFVQKDCNG